MPNATSAKSCQEPLGALLPKRLTGGEAFHSNGRTTGETVCSFWSWAYSTLAANNLRGHLAEFLVASALGVANGKPRIEWDDCDIEAHGLRIEVKSAAYLQAWKQERPSVISFSIAPSFNWEADGVSRKTHAERNSDVYVFCLLTPKDKRELDPTDLTQWEFFILPTEKLNEERREQKSISLNALLQLQPVKCQYEEIASAIGLMTKSNALCSLTPKPDHPG